MQLFVVPDIHGRTNWQQPVTAFLATATPEDRVIFLGDYNDSFTVPDAPMLDNFIDVLLLKEREPERVILLLGNHCFPYLFDPSFRCSGFRPELAPALHLLFRKHQHFFHVACQFGPYLFTHAGVSDMWLEANRLAILVLTGATIGNLHLPTVLNQLLQTDRGRKILWQVSSYNGGRDGVDGPLWVRPRHLERGLLPGLIQVVGHTAQRHIVREVDQTSHTGLILVDCHDHSPTEFLALETGMFI